MRFKITGEHRKVFEQQRYIAFDDLLPKSLVEEAAAGIDALLSSRLRRLITAASPQELFKVGHDLWRQDPTIRRLVQNRALAQVAGELMKKTGLVLAFDQSLRTTSQVGFPGAQPHSLEHSSCIQPLAGAALVRLTGNSHHSFLPAETTSVMFLAPDFLLPWEMFFQEPHHSFLLIAYAPPKALYLLEKNDPHTHELKKLGYAFGDHVGPPHHPILFKVHN
jgi:hypothetical protein